MAQPARPLRADAARNRARVLEVACETFAAEGLSVPIEEIARRAGVGTGTVCRHFPTKQDLVLAVFADRLKLIVDEGQALLASGDPGQALFSFLRLLILDWGATNHGLKNAFAGSEIKIKPKGAEDGFLAILGELLRTAQEAGTARTDVSAADVKGLIIGCQAMQTYNSELAERLVDVVFDGLRAAPAEAR
jgi:AcrR family transcriptional regulator